MDKRDHQPTIKGRMNMANDIYNAYRYDFIDGFEKERRGEHLSQILSEYDGQTNNVHWISEEGLLNESIDITGMELANKLVFQKNFEVDIHSLYEFADAEPNEDDKYKFPKNTLKTIKPITPDIVKGLFGENVYGKINTDDDKYKGTVQAIRVWSGNDHWLLPLESVVTSIRIIPIHHQPVNNENNIPSITQDNHFVLIYWPDSYGNLPYQLLKKPYLSFLNQRNAFLYYPGIMITKQ